MKNRLKTARELDRDDELGGFRKQFIIPLHRDGQEQIYLCGHSLGLQAKAVESAVSDELRAWRQRAVSGHFTGDPAWMDYDAYLRKPLARLVGADPGDVVVMNTLTVNLHLLMVSFYRPEAKRHKILIEKHAFPSDRYAVESQIRFHGLDPADCLVELEPDPSSGLIDEGVVEDYLHRNGDEVALILWPGIQYASGQFFDLGRIATAGRTAGASVGFDLAHAIGNVPLALSETDCDFAVWCNYKYLSGGPGAVAACYVNRRHSGSRSLPRFEGWWGNSRTSRFLMESRFDPADGAEAWCLSNPPILAMAPLKASLGLFEEAGMDRLRQKSIAMSEFLLQGIQADLGDHIAVITPENPERRGCQLSLRVRAGRDAGRRLFEFLEARGVIADWREPDIIRVAPVPLYNRFEDCAKLILHMREGLGNGAAGS